MRKKNSEDRKNSKESKNSKNRMKCRAWIVALGCLLAVVSILAICYGAVRVMGKKSFDYKSNYMIAEMQQAYSNETEQDVEIWQNGWLKFEDRLYEYNTDILIFLFMGIDKDKEVTEVAEGTDGGQADALFMFLLNPKDKTLKVISINRNTMADVKLYDENGIYIKTVEAQIAVQHGFGNGLEESCEYQVDAVRKLFYQLPIHGYCAVNMDAVIELTDIVGGIELVSLENITSAIQDETLGSYVVNKGEHVQLDGRKAYSYVRYRDAEAVGSADMRLVRQHQFLGEFIQKTKVMVKKDLSLPVKLYNAVTSQMVTDVTVNEVAYLASVAADYKFSTEHVYSVPGETVQRELFEEFYVEENDLYRMIIELFYEPVENAVVNIPKDGSMK